MTVTSYDPQPTTLAYPPEHTLDEKVVAFKLKVSVRSRIITSSMISQYAANATVDLVAGPMSTKYLSGLDQTNVDTRLGRGIDIRLRCLRAFISGKCGDEKNAHTESASKRLYGTPHRSKHFQFRGG